MTTTDTSAAPVITDAAEITDEIRAAATDRSEQRARALIAKGVDEDAAVTQAADEAVMFARSLVQLARRGRTLIELVDAYDGNVYRLLRDLGDHLNLSLAYVDRATVEAHVERTLTSTEWAAVSGQFTAMDFDDYVGEQGTWRTAWVEGVLDEAGVPGYGWTTDGADRTQA
jgi:hypothetical protein